MLALVEVQQRTQLQSIVAEAQNLEIVTCHAVDDEVAAVARLLTSLKARLSSLELNARIVIERMSSGEFLCASFCVLCFPNSSSKSICVSSA